MYIIAGLGNPTAQYRGTRHNVGFEVIDYLADKYNIDVTTKKFKGLIGTGAIEGQKVVLVKPQTFMNLSGECIQEVMNYYKTDISDLIVVYDDINLEPGQLRVRGKGSAGGHNGMKYHSALQFTGFSKSACRNRSKAAKDGFSRLCTQPFPGRRKKGNGRRLQRSSRCSMLLNEQRTRGNHESL